MHKHNGYALVGIVQHPGIAYNCDRTRAFFTQFRAHMLRPGSTGNRGNRLLGLLDEQLHDAYRANRPESLHALHVGLNEILFRRFNCAGDHAERSPLMFEVQQRIIQAQLDADLREVGNEALPETPDAFEHWFSMRSQPTGLSPHPLFDFLETHANFAQFRHFIEVEAGVHVSFDDVIALAQVGVRGSPKSEFFRNLQDEVGNEDPDHYHLTMFERLVNGLGIHSIRRSALPWEALACGSYMMFLAHFRHFYPYCIGYLGFLEALTSARFGCITRGGVRLGVATALLDYHTGHSNLDTEHAHGWLHNIILPAIRERGALMSRDIALGVRLREHVAQRYWNAMLTELTCNVHSCEIKNEG
ncbi:iron-containing redox enzyme family protein [Paraburkholderia aspalathi]|uniref:iron-containing redox enzyme family protein n=1 Tax=Paraburkholderia aspalathi TaxID=1324617 RepID=UPI0038B96F8B